jgi:hypothetical protein
MTSTVLLSGFVLMFTVIGIAVLPWSQAALAESADAWSAAWTLVRAPFSRPAPVWSRDPVVAPPTAPMVVRVASPPSGAVVLRPRVERIFAQAS